MKLHLTRHAQAIAPTLEKRHLTAELLTIVTGSGKVLSGRRSALERLETSATVREE